MSKSKSFIVLEIQDHVDVVKECIEFLSLTGQVKAITHREASNVIYYLTRDAVDANLEHKLHNPDNAEFICSMLFGVAKTNVTKQHLTAFEEIRRHSLWQGVEHGLRQQIGNHIKPNSWVDWTVVKSAGLVGLMEGEDHRITEYHKEEKAVQAETDDEAVVTMNCLNPLNYLYNQFKSRYGQNITNLQLFMQNPANKIDPFFRKMVANFMADPSELIAAIFCEGITRVNPQIELSDHCPKLTPALIKMLNIYDLEQFHSKVVSKLVIAIGMGKLSYAIKRDESYALEYYSKTHVVAVYKKQFSTKTEKYEEELLHALNRGDFLPYEERVIAERLFSERANMVLSLQQ